jgi:hypothetical protein
MKLYADYSLMQSNAGPCAAAYLALHLAGHRVDVVYGATPPPFAQHRGRQPVLPVLVTDAGDIVSSLKSILAWTRLGVVPARSTSPESD